MYVIGVFTSQPKSVIRAEDTIRSIMNQTRPPDEVFWHYPYYCKRFKCVYPEIPDWVLKYPQLKVVRCEDYGPSTKIVPLLDRKDVPVDSSILIFDDDTIYHERCVETLMRLQSKNVGVGFSGHTFYTKPFQFTANHDGELRVALSNRVRILLCSGMVLYPRKMFALSSEDYMKIISIHPTLWLNDDHVYGHLAYKSGVPLHLIKSPGTIFHECRDGHLSGMNHTKKAEIQMFMRGMLGFPVAEIAVIISTLLAFAYVIVVVVLYSKI